jgi:hypothetical protein
VGEIRGALLDEDGVIDVALTPADDTPPDDVDARARLSAAIGDGYELGTLLGAGGFAYVYSVEEIDTLFGPKISNSLFFALVAI